jgi:murein DD-endopeptidase MepM/ murein hydrolase activator NlpD
MELSIIGYINNPGRKSNMKNHLSLLLFLSFLLAACTSLAVHRVGSTPAVLLTNTQTQQLTSTVSSHDCLQRAKFGDPARSLYILPYPVGTKHMVDQAYCTIYSHSNQLAYDFAMRFGEKVTAARAGEVKKVVEYFPDSATGDQEFNYVLIQHEDGSVAFYAHLKQNSVMVNVGDQVKAGTLIAQVGKSGMPKGYVPCLHFGVYTSYPPIEGEDVAVNFRNASGRLDDRNGLASGRSYLALPWWKFWCIK